MTTFADSASKDRRGKSTMSPFLRHLRSKASLAKIQDSPSADPNANAASTSTLQKREPSPKEPADEPAPPAEAPSSRWASFQRRLQFPKLQAQAGETSPPKQTPLDPEPSSLSPEPAVHLKPERTRRKLYKTPTQRRVDPMQSSSPQHVRAREMLEALRTMGSPGIPNLTNDETARMARSFSSPTAEEVAAYRMQEIDWSLKPYRRWRRYGDIALHRPPNIDSSGRPHSRTSQDLSSPDKQSNGSALEHQQAQSSLPSRYRNGQRNRVSPRTSPGSSVASIRSSPSGSSRSSQETVRANPSSSYLSYQEMPRYHLYDAPMEDGSTEPSNSIHDYDVSSAEVEAAMLALYVQLDTMGWQDAEAAETTRAKLSATMPPEMASSRRASSEISQGPVLADSTLGNDAAHQERRDTAADISSQETTSAGVPVEATQAPLVSCTVDILRFLPPPPKPRRTPSTSSTIRTAMRLAEPAMEDLDAIKETLLTASRNNTTPPTQSSLISEITWLRAEIQHFSKKPRDAGKKILAQFKLEERLVELSSNRAWQAKDATEAAVDNKALVTARDDPTGEEGGEGELKSMTNGAVRQPSEYVSQPDGAVHWPPPTTSLYSCRHGLSPKAPPPAVYEQGYYFRIELHKGLLAWKSFGPVKGYSLRWPPSHESVYGRRQGLDAAMPPPLTRELSYDGPESPAEWVGDKNGDVGEMVYLGRVGVM